MNTLEYNHSIGNCVYWVELEKPREKCNTCGGHGSLKRFDDIQISCPICYSEGSNPYGHEKLPIVKCGKIVEIGISIDVKSEIEITYWLRTDNSYESWFTVYEPLLFSTEEEARNSINI